MMTKSEEKDLREALCHALLAGFNDISLVGDTDGYGDFFENFQKVSAKRTIGEGISDQYFLHQDNFKFTSCLSEVYLSPTTNFLAAILVRIGNLLDITKVRSFDFADNGIASEISMFQQSAVAWWNGLSPERISSLDPAYAACEVATIEHYGANLSSQLDHLMKSLLTYLGVKKIVVPVDFSLPSLPTDLVKAMKVLKHPDLVFLVLKPE